MSDTPFTPPESSLYGSDAQPPKPKAPGLGEIFLGLFTEPSRTFARIREAGVGVWLWPAVLSMLAGVLLVVAWATKVDVDALMRPALEANARLGAEQVDAIIAMQGKMLLPMGIVGGIFGTAFGVLIMGLIYWGLGVASSEDRDRKPGFLDGVNMSAVLGLVVLPYQLLTALMCFLRPVGGLSPEKLSPTSLGFFLHPANPKLYAFYCSLDLFMVASWVLTYVAARHLLRARAWGAALCTAIPVLFVVLKIAFAK